MVAPPDKREPHAGRARAWRAGRIVLAVLVIATFSVAGGAIALRTSSEGVYTTSAGQLTVDIKPAFDGQVELFVPIVNWQLVADAYDAPVTITIEARSIQ